MRSKDILDFFLLSKIKHTKENLLFFCRIFDVSSFLVERINKLVILLLDNDTMVTVLSNVVHHDNIIWSWVLHNILDIISCREFNHVV